MIHLIFCLPVKKINTENRIWYKVNRAGMQYNSPGMSEDKIKNLTMRNEKSRIKNVFLTQILYKYRYNYPKHTHTSSLIGAHIGRGGTTLAIKWQKASLPKLFTDKRKWNSIRFMNLWMGTTPCLAKRVFTLDKLTFTVGDRPTTHPSVFRLVE